MNAQKEKKYNTNSSIIMYIIMVLLISIICQILTDRILNKYELFLAANYDDLLVNLFTAQVTVIILPLSLFGIFTEITNEVYLGQSIAEYMYMYKGGHFFTLRYKELAISSMALTLVEYFLMAKGLLAAELTTFVLNTIAMLASLFSWFEVRIRKEKLHAFIQEQLYKKIEICTRPEGNNISERDAILVKVLSKLKDWVVNGGDYELVEAMQFYQNLSPRTSFWNTAVLIQNAEKDEPVKELLSSYRNIDTYFDELVADLLRKQDYYRALRCSKDMLETIAWNRVTNYYHPKHYHYHIIVNLFSKLNEMEIELLGTGWFCDYLVTILKNGNVKGIFAQAAQSEKPEDLNELQLMKEEGYILVFELLMSVWQNNNLQPEYRHKQMKEFLSDSIMDLKVKSSALCICLKLMETKDQTVIDMVVKTIWRQLDSFINIEEQEFYEKSIVLILAYGYYLAVYTKLDITIPQLNKYDWNTNTFPIMKYYLWEVLTDYVWKWYDKIKAFLNINNKLDENFRNNYYDVIYDIMLYGAMAHKQCPAPVKNNTSSDHVIHHFRFITGNDKFLEAAISRYKKYIDLFGAEKITDQMIHDQFYQFKKVILQHYIDSLKKAAAEFNKEAFLEDLRENVWEELLTDQQFEANLCDLQVSGEDITAEAVHHQPYLILPDKRICDAYEIKHWLCARLQKNTAKTETCDQKITRTYHVLSLDWTDEKLNEEEIEYFIKKEQEFVVKFQFYNMDVCNIYAMNFRTYEEAYAFVKSEYRKVVFRMKVKI